MQPARLRGMLLSAANKTNTPVALHVGDSASQRYSQLADLDAALRNSSSFSILLWSMHPILRTECREQGDAKGMHEQGAQGYAKGLAKGMQTE